MEYLIPALLLSASRGELSVIIAQQIFELWRSKQIEKKKV